MLGDTYYDTVNDVIRIYNSDSVWENLNNTKLFSRSADADADIFIGDYVRADTSNAAITLKLPKVPKVGCVIEVRDITGSFGTNKCTLDGNGANINGAATADLAVNNMFVNVTYDGSTNEWRVNN